MKKNRLFMLGLVTVFVAVLSLTLVSSTFARYTSTVTGGDSARVAKWLVTYKDQNETVNGAASQTDITFDLFNGVKELDNDGNPTNEAETDISDATGALIAPETGGTFEFTLSNSSEVNSTYAITYTITNTPNIPLQYRVKVGTGEYSEWTNTLANVAATPLAHTSGTVTYTIQWRWVGQEGNAGDTTLGVNANTAAQEIAINATIVFEQVD